MPNTHKKTFSFVVNSNENPDVFTALENSKNKTALIIGAVQYFLSDREEKNDRMVTIDDMINMHNSLLDNISDMMNNITVVAGTSNEPKKTTYSNNENDNDGEIKDVLGW